MTEPEVICEKCGSIGLILLNRPQALNALTLNMIRLMTRALDAWAKDAAVSAIVVKGAGEKAFCAGGDMRQIYKAGKAGDHETQCAFWREEFALNMKIKFYPKPYVALLAGITMGGGAGISIHGSHRVASEGFVFAMPETQIGYFPDVGSTYFLSRLPHGFGNYLAFTGARINAGDAIALGLAQAFVPAAWLDALTDALAAGEGVDAAIARHKLGAPRSLLANKETQISALFSCADAASLFKRFSEDNSPFAKECLAALKSASPTSLAIAMRQMELGPTLDFIETMKMDYGIASRLCRAEDLYEGMRAQLIDKDKKPRWRPQALEHVAKKTVDAYFTPVDGSLTTGDFQSNISKTAPAPDDARRHSSLISV